MGLCVLLSKPVKMSRFLSSGRRRVTSSSSVIRPRSTHCKAATVVMSLVHEARQKVASTSSGTSKPSSFTKRVPNGFWKCALPVHSQSPWSFWCEHKGNMHGPGPSAARTTPGTSFPLQASFTLSSKDIFLPKRG
jgi:hypothetical protein